MVEQARDQASRLPKVQQVVSVHGVREPAVRDLWQGLRAGERDGAKGDAGAEAAQWGALELVLSHLDGSLLSLLRHDPQKACRMVSEHTY